MNDGMTCNDLYQHISSRLPCKIAFSVRAHARAQLVHGFVEVLMDLVIHVIIPVSVCVCVCVCVLFEGGGGNIYLFQCVSGWAGGWVGGGGGDGGCGRLFFLPRRAVLFFLFSELR